MKGGKQPGAGRPLETGHKREHRVSLFLDDQEMRKLDALLLPEESRAAGIRRILGERDSTGLSKVPGPIAG